MSSYCHCTIVASPSRLIRAVLVGLFLWSVLCWVRGSHLPTAPRTTRSGRGLTLCVFLFVCHPDSQLLGAHLARDPTYGDKLRCSWAPLSEKVSARATAAGRRHPAFSVTRTTQPDVNYA